MSDLPSDFDEKRRTATAFGERLRARRDFLGLTQGDVVKKSGISLASIQSYERGNIPKGDYLLVLSDMLNCSIDWLLKGEESQNDTPESSSSQPQAPPAPPPEDDFKMTEMVTMTVEVLESETIYRTALASNIRAFHQAVRSERTLAKLEERVAAMEAKLEHVAQLEQSVEELRRENQELRQRQNEQPSQSSAVGE